MLRENLPHMGQGSASSCRTPQEEQNSESASMVFPQLEHFESAISIPHCLAGHLNKTN
jgi:hypothetical protein